jgi:hypothetical protein
MKKRGLEFIYQYGVDNILIHMGDPVFVGFVADRKAECASKVVQKDSPDEPGKFQVEIIFFYFFFFFPLASGCILFERWKSRGCGIQRNFQGNFAFT